MSWLSPPRDHPGAASTVTGTPVRIDVAVSGSYKFRVSGSSRGGSSNVDQGGPFAVKAKEAVKKVAGISDATVADAAAGNLDVQFAPMEAGDKSGAVKGATQEQIRKALKDAGLTATTDILPAATAK